MRKKRRAKHLESASNPGGAVAAGISSWPGCAAVGWAVTVPAGRISLLRSIASLSTRGSSWLLPHLHLPSPGEEVLQTIRVPFACRNLDHFGAAERSSLPASLAAGARLVGRGGMASCWGEEQALQAACWHMKGLLKCWAAFLSATQWQEQLL